MDNSHDAPHTNDTSSTPAESGNASNPSPVNEPGESNQLIDKKGEKYLREVANIEDMPDAQDQQDMDETIQQEKNK